MVGGVIGGYSETERRNTATPPSRIMTNAMTFASTGCSMKNLANMTTPDAGQGLINWVLLSIGTTLVPGRAFRSPFTTTRSVGVSPLRMARPSEVSGLTPTDRVVKTNIG